MKWKTKALLQSVLSNIPVGEEIYFSLQKHFGGFKNFRVLSKVDQAINILQILKDNNIDINNKRICEIGTGWVPIIPFMFYIFGQRSCTSFDVQRLLKPNLFIDAVKEITGLSDYFQRKIPWAWNEAAMKRLTVVSQHYPDCQTIFREMQFIYLAPVNTPFKDIPSDSIDIVVSNDTFEHIPRNDLANLLRSSREVMNPDGIAIHVIDCSDHYSHSDQSISRINFLKFNESEWQKYNTRFLYQNRLRASDFRQMFKDGGFEIIDWRQKTSSDFPPSLSDIKIAPEFEHYNINDLTSTEISVVAKVIE